MKKILFTLLFSTLCLALAAQDFEIVSVESLPADFSAREEIKADHSDRQCALLRIATQNITPNQREGFSFVPDLGSEVVERATRDGEIWLWVSPGLKYLRIKHREWGQYELRMPDYVARVEALHTYKVTVKGTMLMTLQEQNNNSPTQQYLVFQLLPTNATLEVDDQLWSVDADGTAMKYVNFGTYTYRVRASDYFSETGKVTVDDPNNTKIVTLSLKPNFATVTLKVDADAEIWVNNVKKGVRSWTGQLGSGTYKIECKKVNHETTVVSKEITTEMNGQTIILPTPIPIYGSLNVECSPNICNLFIDGKEAGSTPKTIPEMLIGIHEIRLAKDGYNDCIDSVIITKGEQALVKATLEKASSVRYISGVNDSLTPFSSNSYPNNSDLLFTVNGVSYTMIFVEGGSFQMGALEKQDDAFNNEEPVHNVTLNSYYLSETEVTQELWEAIMGNNPSFFKGKTLPVEQVNWDDCQEFIQRLNQMTGRNFRLPTEAEWEFAARGGKKGKNNKYAGSDFIDCVAWYSENTNDKGTKGVKLLQPNELGMYDMSGNVFEWCSDFYGDYTKKSRTNPQGPSKGKSYVLRGGCWYYYAGGCRVSARNSSTPDTRSNYIGFRLCLSE